jgi:hypothetical protein
LAANQLHPEHTNISECLKREPVELPLMLPDPSENPKAWTEALKKQGRIHGIKGVLHVWSERERQGYKLPTQGHDANSLWTTLFRAVIVKDARAEHKQLFKAIYRHALEPQRAKELRWPGIYVCVVGLWLRIEPRKARVTHKQLLNAFDCSNVDLRDLAQDCVFSYDSALAFSTFRYIYKSFPNQKLYDAFLSPMLSDHHNFGQRLSWHKFFTSRGDLPSSELFALPLIRELFAKQDKHSTPQARPPDIGGSNPAIARPQDHQFPALTRASMSTIVGDVHGIKPKEFSDAFVAKLLATWAFPLDFLVSGVSFLAIESLGPQALHQLAIRCGNCLVFQEKIDELKQSGIGLQTNNYSRVMEHIAREGLEYMFQTLLLSDQHPDTFEDMKVQSALLRAFLNKGDVQNAHLTLIVLSFMNDEGNATAWNAVLAHSIIRRDGSMIEDTVRRMRELHIAVNLANLQLFRSNMVGVRNSSKRLTIHSHDRRRPELLSVLRHMAMFSLCNGVNVGPNFWVEMLKRYGMIGDWKNLEPLVIWLCSQYGNPQDKDWASRCGLTIAESHRDRHVIFSGQMLAALVVWGFRAPVTRRSLRQTQNTSPSSRSSADLVQPESWARGIILLRRIELQFRLHTLPSARKAFVSHMWILFGPGYSTRGDNTTAIRRQTLTLPHYVLHANKIFEGRLFPDAERILQESGGTNSPALMEMLFGQMKSTSRHRQEVADVRSFARDQSAGVVHHKSFKARHRERTWFKSEYRHLLEKRKPRRARRILV